MKRILLVIISLLLVLSCIGTQAETKPQQRIILVDEFFDSFMDLENSVWIVKPVVKELKGIAPKYLSCVYENSKVAVRADVYAETGVVYQVMLQREGNLTINPRDIYLALSGLEFEEFLKEENWDASYLTRGDHEFNGYKVNVWSQDNGDSIVHAILIDEVDPHVLTRAISSEELFNLYGSPISLNSTAANEDKTLDSGDYIVGQHIAAGEYSVKAVQYAFFGLTRSGDLVRSEALGPDNRIGRIVLQAGDDVEISGGSVVFTPLD